MSERKHETVADIVAEMRRCADSHTYGRTDTYQGEIDDALCAIPIDDYADRIEAAMKRNCADNCAWSHIYTHGLDEIRAENEMLKQRLARCERVNEQQDKDYCRIREETKRDIETISTDYGKLIHRLRDENARLRAALAKVTSVVTKHYAARNLGDKGREAVAEIMSACRFPDGALDECARSFAERDRLRAALKPVLECDISNDDLCGMCAGREYCWPNVGESRSWCDNKLMCEAVREAQRIYNESEDVK